MKKTAASLAALLLAVALAGCSTPAKTILLNSQSERTDVFKEAPAANPARPGYGDVLIKASIKTHLEKYYIAEPNDQAHGKPAYPFLINIDGQAVLWNAPGALDTKPAYDENGRTSRDPEARDGMKYLLEKKIQLRAGKHRVFFGLPEEEYYMVADIEVNDGNSYVLEFKPIYRYKTLPARIPSFFLGIRRYEVRFDTITKAATNAGLLPLPAQP